jgi:3'-phosphoadenosine 5'-phosphosulfate sulfotransferase (PAPS reductase)/FAD synthetase
VWNFTTAGTVTLSSPSNNPSPTGRFYSRQYLRWNTLPGSSEYLIQLDTTSDFSSSVVRNISVSTSSTNTDSYYEKCVYDLYYGTMYYWRVCAISSVDTTDWSETWQFHTMDDVLLTFPSDTSENGTYFTRQEFQWKNSLGSTLYILQLDTTPSFSSGLLQTYTTTNSNSNTDTYIYKYISDMRYGTMYYWRVCSANAVDTSGWSATWRFHTTDWVVLYSLSNDTSSTAGYYTRQELEWKNSKGSKSYILQLDTVPSFDSGLLRSIDVSSSTTNTDTYIYKYVSDMRYGTMYYWRVCAINNADTSGWSATWQFHTVDWVVLDSPSNNSTGLAVSSRTLYWKNSRGSSSYIVQVDTTTSFNSELLRNLSVSSSTTNTDTYKSTSITNMLYGTTYYWRVCAINEAVDTSGWSSVWNFTTAYQLTTGPVLVSPENNSTEIQPSGVNLVWNPLDNVTGYRYQVSTDNTFATIYRSGTTANTTATCYLNYGTTYYWRVQGYNASGNSVWSQVWSFDTQSCELTGETTVEACGSYIWRGTTYTESGDYNFTKHLSNGCDSIITLHLTINQSSEREFSYSACESYTWNGVTYDESGDYVQNITASNGCDSVVTLHLTINHSLTELVEVEACNSYQWNNQTYTESGDYQQTFTAANGCDSVVTLRLTINESPTREFAATSCVGYTWNGQTYTTSGTYTQNIASNNGCDSIVTLHLTINQPLAHQFEATACESYNWNGTTYTASGNYQQTFTATNGCDSVVTLHLTINHPTTAEFAVSACDSYVWNGETYTESGNYTQTFIIANGCDSVVTLHLTINHPQTQQFEAEACNFYVWNGVSYNESGDYVQTLSAATGCDSVVTLHLVINEPVTYEFDTSVNEAFVWNGETFTETGDYTRTFTAANGCDSIVTLHLNVITGISEAEMQISIFPNPANDILNITSSEQISEIEIVNALGQVVKRVEVNADNAVCNVEDLTSGMYVVRIRTMNLSKGAVVSQRKFIKE